MAGNREDKGCRCSFCKKIRIRLENLYQDPVTYLSVMNV